MQDGAGPSEAKVFRADAPLRCACVNLVCGLKLLGNMHMGGSNLVDMIFEGIGTGCGQS